MVSAAAYTGLRLQYDALMQAHAVMCTQQVDDRRQQVEDRRNHAVGKLQYQAGPLLAQSLRVLSSTTVTGLAVAD